MQVRECSDWLLIHKVVSWVLFWGFVLSFLVRSVLPNGSPQSCGANSFLYTSLHSRILPTMTLAIIFEVSRDLSCHSDIMAVRSSQFRLQHLVYFLFRPSALAVRVSHNAP